MSLLQKAMRHSTIDLAQIADLAVSEHERGAFEDAREVTGENSSACVMRLHDIASLRELKNGFGSDFTVRSRLNGMHFSPFEVHIAVAPVIWLNCRILQIPLYARRDSSCLPDDSHNAPK